jgi:hypothetical protein
VNETVGRRRIDSFNDLANLVDVDLVWELCPEDNASFGKSRQIARAAFTPESLAFGYRECRRRVSVRARASQSLRRRRLQNGNVIGEFLFENLA